MASAAPRFQRCRGTKPAGLGGSLEARVPVDAKDLPAQRAAGRAGRGSGQPALCPGSVRCSRPSLCIGLTVFYLVPPWESFRANPRLMRAQEQSKVLLGRE